MKTVLLLTICLCFCLTGFSQETGNDSYTIQRLIIFNKKGEILLEKHENGWMTPALRHNTKVSINEAFYSLSSEFGLKISVPKLSGMYMFIPEYKPQSSIRQHYSCTLIEGELQLPEGKQDAQWFAPQKPIEMMSLPDTKLIFAVRDMTKKILDYPDIVWGGTFYLWKKNGVTKYKLAEDFYSLTE